MTEYKLRQKPARNTEPELLDVSDWAFFLAFCALLIIIAFQFHRSVPQIVDSDTLTAFSETRARLQMDNVLKNSIDTKCHVAKCIFEELRKMNYYNKNNHHVMDIVVKTSKGRVELEDTLDNCRDFQNTSIVVQMSSVSITPRSYVTLACKISSHSGSEGKDDIVSHAILLDILRVFTHATEPLSHNIVFIFYAGIESMVDVVPKLLHQNEAQHERSPLLIMENTGFSQREMSFNANSWLHQLYLQSATYRLPNALAIEFLQGVWDKKEYPYFREHGLEEVFPLNMHQVGFFKHGWTGSGGRFNSTSIETGTIQRFFCYSIQHFKCLNKQKAYPNRSAGEDVMSLVNAILDIPDLSNSENLEERIIFNDILGRTFSIKYSQKNAICVILCFPLILLVIYGRHFKSSSYSIEVLASALLTHYISTPLMVITSLLPATITIIFDLTNYWYTSPLSMLLLHTIPPLLVGINAHANCDTTRCIALDGEDSNIMKKELAHYDCIMGITGVFTFVCIQTTPVSFFFTSYVIVPVSRVFLIWCLLYVGIIERVTPKILLFCQFICHIPIIISSTYFIMFCLEHLDMLTKRFGNDLHPELVMSFFSLFLASLILLFVHNLIYISRQAAVDAINVVSGVSIIFLAFCIYYSPTLMN